MGSRILCVAFLSVLLLPLATHAGPGVVGPGAVAALVEEERQAAALLRLGGELLAAASKANVGKPAVGMKGVPQGNRDLLDLVKAKVTSLKSSATKIVQPAQNRAVTLLRKASLIGRRLKK